MIVEHPQKGFSKPQICQFSLLTNPGKNNVLRPKTIFGLLEYRYHQSFGAFHLQNQFFHQWKYPVMAAAFAICMETFPGIFAEFCE